MKKKDGEVTSPEVSKKKKQRKKKKKEEEETGEMRRMERVSKKEIRAAEVVDIKQGYMP